MRRVPVFPAAAVGDDEIESGEMRPQLGGEVRRTHFGGEDLVALSFRIDVPEEDQFVHARISQARFISSARTRPSDSRDVRRTGHPRPW